MKSLYFKRIIVPAVMAATAASLTAGTPAASKLSPACKIALSAQHERRAVAGTSSAYLRAFLTVADDFDSAILEKEGVKVGVRAGDVLTARIPLDALARVSALPGVLYVEAAGDVMPMLDLARKEAGVPYEVTGSDSQVIPCTGKGVILGVIDRGFDYTHEAFRDADGNCRISRVWEQGSKATGFPAPEKFGYGVELTSAADLNTAEGDVEGNSHGTHVAGIAAGSSAYRDGAYVGTAPEAEIVLVSMDAVDGDNATLADAMDYIFDYAEQAGKPCVINMSLGSQIGPHDGTSAFDKIADALSGPGRLLVGSAGNHGNDAFHVSRTFSSADDAPLGSFIDFKRGVGTNNTGGVIDIWGDKDMQYNVELICYSKGKASIVETLTVNMEAAEAVDYSFAENITGPFTVAVEKNPNNGKLHVMIKSGVNQLRNRYYAGIRIVPLSAGKVDVWSDNNYLGLTSNDIEGYTAPSSEFSTIAEIGGTASSVLTVGAYTTRDEYTVMGNSSPSTIGQTLNDVCTFSSFGPTADGRQKPEITAPGCFILSAVSSHDNGGTQILGDYNEAGEYRYGYMQGTSMSAPFVTGIVAGWLQIDPMLDPVQLKETVQQTARRDSFVEGGSSVRWGAGKIDPRGGAMLLLTNGVTNVYGDAEGKPLIWPGEIVFPCAGRAEIVISDMAGRVVSTTDANVAAGESFKLTRDALDVASGIYIVSVLTPQGRTTAKLSL